VGSGGIEPPYLTSSLDGDEWSVSIPGHFICEEIAIGTYCQEDRKVQGTVWELWREKNLFFLPGVEPWSPSP
jgi:hypothetical protein